MADRVHPTPRNVTVFSASLTGGQGVRLTEEAAGGLYPSSPRFARGSFRSIIKGLDPQEPHADEELQFSPVPSAMSSLDFREDMHDGVQGADISEELPDDFGGKRKADSFAA
ncbi:hypothetical protein EJB05_29759, partial [Eragrostis curvula]